jgi:uncharacterized protein (DUF885 family)
MRRFVASTVFVLLASGALALGAVPWHAPSLADIEQALDGLDFDQFVETSYRLYVLRSPQTVTSMGLAAEFGMRNDALDDYSSEYESETFAIESLILERLRAFDREALTGAQQVTYDVCLWYWDDRVRGQAFSSFQYPVHFLSTWSLPGLLEFTLMEKHPFASADDVEDYVARLERVGAQLDQIIARLDRDAERGVIVPRPALEWAIPGIRTMAVTSSRSHSFYRTLAEKSADIPGLSVEERDGYLRRAVLAMDQVVKPAYDRLLDAVYALLTRASREISLGQFDDGAEAYAYLLRHHTQTELTPYEIHQLGLREVARVQSDVRAAAEALGFDDTTSMTAIFEQTAVAGGSVVGEAAVDEAERLLEKAKRIVLETGALSRLPSRDVVAIGVPNGGYYSPPSLDGTAPGAYYVTTSGSGALYTMPTVAYHETIPGHHVQIATAQELDLPLLRQDVVFTGFSEGWALYAERLMSELGAYDDDPYGNLGRLQYELIRAVRLVADTGIHDLGWSFDQAVSYIMENAGEDRGTAESRALRYTVEPGQATAYMVGLLEILDLREQARDALGDAFDLASFHDVLLGFGNVPLSYAVDLVRDWIAANAS